MFRFKISLQKLIDDGLDKEFLSTVIQYEFSWEFNNFEKSPHDIVALRAIDHFLYGQTALNVINLKNSL